MISDYRRGFVEACEKIADRIAPSTVADGGLLARIRGIIYAVRDDTVMPQDPKATRSTLEVIEAARMGEPCTEEELRLAVVSMRHTYRLFHFDIARWATDETLPLSVRLKANLLYESMTQGWSVPLDERVGPEDRPGNPDLYRRRELAERLVEKARKLAAERDLDPSKLEERAERTSGRDQGDG